MQDRQKNTHEDNIRPIFLVLSIIVGFIILVVFTLTYIAQEYSPLYECGCAYTLPILIVLLSSTGIFVGVLTYYLLAGKYSKEKKGIIKNIDSTYNFLEAEERKILRSLVKNKGNAQQSVLNKETGMDRVKVFRVLSRMEQKGILKKEKKGKSNIIILEKDIYELFDHE